MKWKRFGVMLLLALGLGAAVLTAAQVEPTNAQAILYLGWDAQERIQLYRIQTGDDAPTQLTQETAVILHYAPTPNGEKIAYTTGDAIWLMDANGRNRHNILACPHPPCDQLRWHPDNIRLLYEQQGQLWWLDTANGETVPLKENAAGPSSSARFSADGAWVSYVVSPEEGIEFYNFEDGRHFQIASILGTPAIWHPTDPTFLHRDQRLITYHGGEGDNHQEHSHDFALADALYLADVNNPGGVLISGDTAVDDGTPAWSPDGEWIVFGRKPPRTANGRQLWLARPDGSEAKALTDEPLIHHGLPQWSGDGRFILYQRYDTANPDSKPAIWLLKIATGETQEMAPAGFQPEWLPVIRERS